MPLRQPVHVTGLGSLNPCIVEPALHLDNTLLEKLIPRRSLLALSTADLCTQPRINDPVWRRRLRSMMGVPLDRIGGRGD
jgi:hypothetical protein